VGGPVETGAAAPAGQSPGQVRGLSRLKPRRADKSDDDTPTGTTGAKTSAVKGLRKKMTRKD
jgi:hypothetical protein